MEEKTAGTKEPSMPSGGDAVAAGEAAIQAADEGKGKVYDPASKCLSNRWPLDNRRVGRRGAMSVTLVFIACLPHLQHLAVPQCVSDMDACMTAYLHGST